MSDDSLESIRRVKALETETAEKLAALKERSKSDLDGVTRAAESDVSKSRSDAEASRDATVARARADADREAEAILVDGKKKAAEIRGKSPQELAALKDPILTAVLGEFRAKGKRSEA